MIHEANGARFIAKNDMIVRWCGENSMPFEPETTKWMFRAVKKGGSFVDVGASTGWFAIPMALRGYSVIAFEPNPDVFARLTENAALNEVNFPTYQAAASEKAGTSTMFINPAVPLTSGGSIEAATCSKPKRISVRTVRLDDVVSGDVGLLKIDVEGHELSVLRGAEQTIRQCRPHLVLEANTDAHCAMLSEWLEAHDYTWQRADDRNMLCTPKS